MRRLEQDVTTLNPICAYSAADRYITNYLFTPLINLDHRFQPSPGIAASWTVSSDHLRYTFVLNSATFSDGTRVKASDVLFTLRKLLDPKSESPISESFRDLDLARTRVINERTIEIVFHRALVTQLTRFADVYVLPEHVYGQGDFRNDFNDRAVGSGPYRLVGRERRKAVTLERREDYWKEQPPIRRVVFTVIVDHQTAWLALLAGEIDESFLPSDIWQRERTNPRLAARIAFLSFYKPSYNFIVWNVRHPLLRDKRVRRALSMTVPVNEIVDHIYHGTARTLSGPFTPDNDAYNHDVPQIAYAPDGARRLLADAGWRDDDNDGVLEKGGKRLEITLQIMTQNNSQRFASVVQAEFGRIGVDLQITVTDASVAIGHILQGNYDAAYVGWDLDVDPDLYSTFHSSQMPPHGVNIGFYTNAEVDRLIEKARAEFDRPKRQQLHHRLHALLAEDQPYTWIAQPSVKWAVNTRVQNVYNTSAAEFRLWYPGDFGWWIDRGSQHSPVFDHSSMPGTQPPEAPAKADRTVPSWFDVLVSRYHKNEKQPWLWLITGAGASAGTYIVGVAAILLLAWTRGSRFIARSRLRKAALAPLRVLPVFARWVLLLGYKRRLLDQTSPRATTKYFGLSAVLDGGAQIVADLTGEQLHNTVAANVAPQRPLFIVGTGGSGKSTLLARLAQLGVTRGLPDALDSHVPVLVDAADYSGDIVLAIAAALRDRAGVDVSDDRELVIDFLQSGRFLILFDGLSEVFGDQRQALHEIVRTASGAALRTCCVIVATREITGNVLRARTLELQPLTEPVIETLLDHYRLTASAKNRMRLQISAFGGQKIEPLLFTMILQASGDGALAGSRSKLYERYFRMQLKARTNDDWLGWADALEALAARFVLPVGRRGYGLTHAQAIDFLDGRREGMLNEESTASRLHRMYHLQVGDALGLLNSLANAGILVRDRRIRFAHDTFEEYFVARAIVSRHVEGTWVLPEWFRDPQHTRELAELARFLNEMTDENPLGSFLAMHAVDQKCAFEADNSWRFDETAISESWVVAADVQQFMPVARPALERAILEIQANPLASPRTVVRGEVIHIKRIPAVIGEDIAFPALLLAYAAKKRDRLIRLLSLCRAADAASDAVSSDDQLVAAALLRILEAMNDVKNRR